MLPTDASNGQVQELVGAFRWAYRALAGTVPMLGVGCRVWGYIGIVENRMETDIEGLGFRISVRDPL